MDLSLLGVTNDVDTGVEMEVVHPSTKEPFVADYNPINKKWETRLPEEPLGIYLTLIGQDSAQYQRRMRAYIDKTRNRTKLPFSETEKYIHDNRVASVVGWRGVIVDGVELQYSPENVARVLDDSRFRFLNEQIDEFVAERGNFMKSNAIN